MRSIDRSDEVTLVGTIESARESRKALLAARDLLPDGEVRDEIVALAIHLRYAIEQALGENAIEDADGPREPYNPRSSIVIEALGARRIEALKTIRAVTGWSLREAMALEASLPYRLECHTWIGIDETAAKFAAAGIAYHIEN